jgi:hypothetical protein
VSVACQVVSERWPQVSYLKTSWKGFPTIFSGKSDCLYSQGEQTMEFCEYYVHVPIDPIALDIHEVKEARAQRIILDGVKDHLIPHLAEKSTTKGMWDTLKNLFEAKNENQKMALKDKLHSTRMAKGESVASYLTRVAQVKDELAVVGEVIADSELVCISLKGFTKDWDMFFKCVVGREKLLDWSRLWDDFTQEEIWERSQGKYQEKKDGGASEENVALIGKRKGKKKGEWGIYFQREGHEQGVMLRM